MNRLTLLAIFAMLFNLAMLGYYAHRLVVTFNDGEVWLYAPLMALHFIMANSVWREIP